MPLHGLVNAFCPRLDRFAGALEGAPTALQSRHKFDVNIGSSRALRAGVNLFAYIGCWVHSCGYWAAALAGCVALLSPPEKLGLLPSTNWLPREKRL
jgi:hypothetical protein